MTAEKSKKDRLGKGLAALLGESMPEEEGALQELALDAIVPNPFQPRQDFSEEELEELSRSIDENGLLQPLVVRPASSGDRTRYQLVAGERRLRAVRRLEWSRVPAVVRDVDDQTLLVLALVENLQRQNLNPLEEAEGYKVLVDDFGLTQQEVAESVGKDRSTISNTLRLLGLPPSIRKLLQKGALSMGHARALLALDDQVRAGELARRAASEGWSVREVERRVRKRLTEASDEEDDEDREGRTTPGSRRGDPVLEALEEEMRKSLSTRAEIRRSKDGSGRIVVPFHDDEDFERLFALITGREAADVVG